MNHPSLRHGLTSLCIAAGTLATPAIAQPTWIGAWTASPQPTWGGDFAFPTNVPPTLANQTFRQVARIGLGGHRVRLVLSNEYGTRPLLIGAVHLARAREASAIDPQADRVVTFGGQPSVTVPAGAPVLSDPIDLDVPDRSRLAVSVWLPARVEATTFHWDGRSTAWIAPGNRAAASRLDDAGATTTTARLFLSAIQVETPTPARAVVVIGDSITDGNGATLDADTRWPDYLAARLAPSNVAVLNAGISGARLMGDRMGVNALARFDRDVLSQPRLSTVVVMLGINDIAWPGTAFDPQGEPPSPQALIAAYRQLIARAHAQGVRIVGATLAPFEGALPGTPLDNYYDRGKDALRERVNAWMRSSHEFDAVLDADALLRDPAHPARLRALFDSGDHLHPGDRGNEALAAAANAELLFAAAPLRTATRWPRRRCPPRGPRRES
jgi:lysophospholipase L1-like esterase